MHTLSPRLKALSVLILIEVVSALVVFFPIANGIVALILASIAFVITCLRPEWGMVILSTELLIGSKGGLFRLGGDAQNNGGIPIRILLFIAVLGGWGIWSLRTRSWKEWLIYTKGRTIYLVLALILIQAFWRGVQAHNPSVLADANSWGMWFLLLPIVDIIFHRAQELKRVLIPVLEAALLWVALKTLLLFYLFSHAFPPSMLETIYLWVRRTGVGEITRASGTAYRIFFQSHIYALGVVLMLWAKQVVLPKLSRFEHVLLVLSMTEILISLSRSFWLGLAAAGIVLLGWFLCYHRSGWKRVMTTGVSSVMCAVLLVAGLLAFPLPPGDGALTSLVRTRLDTHEDAATSRWKLLPMLWQGIQRAPLLGSGFGSTITYQSHDPRVVQATGGVYTTYAFEWGWLDLWYKLGLGGVIVMIVLLMRLARRSFHASTPEWVRWGIGISLLALAVTHFFTPYLNHPLGFGILLALEGYGWVVLLQVRTRIDSPVSPR